MDSNPWVLTPIHRENPEFRLFCLPHAGGGASAYRAWPRYFSDRIDVRPVQFPGRENRLTEPARDSLDVLVDELLEHLGPLMDVPYALFGHSLGALVAYSMARRQQDLGQRGPEVLYASSHRAPHIPRLEPPSYTLPHDELFEVLREMGGIHPELAGNRDFVELLMPTMRADLAAAETYVWTDAAPLECALAAFGGEEDLTVSRQQVAAWRQHTTGPFQSRIFAGGHFYLHDRPAQVLGEVAANLERILDGDAPWTGDHDVRGVCSVTSDER